MALPAACPAAPAAVRPAEPDNDCLDLTTANTRQPEHRTSPQNYIWNGLSQRASIHTYAHARGDWNGLSQRGSVHAHAHG